MLQVIPNLEKPSISEFYDWLKENGYRSCGGGWWDGVDWIYINLNSKVYFPGMPGIPVINGVVGEHCITADEFKLIHGIYQKYEGKEILKF